MNGFCLPENLQKDVVYIILRLVAEIFQIPFMQMMRVAQSYQLGNKAEFDIGPH